jgi:predicted dehydrogenase
MKFLIAGLGSIGRRHLRNLVALGQDDILLYRTGRSTLPDEELKAYPVETDLPKALAHKPDGVIVANPTSLHMQVAIPAARAGCHLLLEKPVSDELSGADELLLALKAGGGQALVGFQFRFHPGLRRVKELLASNAIGEVVSARAHWGEYLPNWHPWEDYRQGYAARADLGGGVVRTLCHPLDYLGWLLGRVGSVWSFTSRKGLNLEVEDSAEIGLQFSSGVIGSVHLNYVQQPPEHHLEIIGAQGTLRWDNADGSVQVYTAGDNATWQSFPAPLGFERNQMFLDQTRHFLKVMRGEEKPVCSLEEGIQTQRLVDTVYRSAAEQKMVTV